MARGIVMMGQIQVTPRWADDPVRRYVGGGSVGAGGGSPPPEENKEAGREVGAGQVNKYVTISDRS